MKAPSIQRHIDWLKRVNYHEYNNTFTYDQKSYQLIEEIFRLLKQLEPTSSKNIYELWLQVDRGTIHDYGLLEDAIDCGEVTNQKEFEDLWQSEFPDAVYWYHFSALEDDEIGYKAIFMDHRQIIEVDSRKEPSIFRNDISLFVEWLLSSVSDCLTKLRNQTYNNEIRKSLPPQHRTGVIIRKDYYDIFPEYRSAFSSEITQTGIDRFIQYIDLDKSEPPPKLSDMTANDFSNFVPTVIPPTNMKVLN